MDTSSPASQAMMRAHTTDVITRTSFGQGFEEHYSGRDGQDQQHCGSCNDSSDLSDSDAYDSDDVSEYAHCNDYASYSDDDGDIYASGTPDDIVQRTRGVDEQSRRLRLRPQKRGKVVHPDDMDAIDDEDDDDDDGGGDDDDNDDDGGASAPCALPYPYRIEARPLSYYGYGNYDFKQLRPIDRAGTGTEAASSDDRAEDHNEVLGSDDVKHSDKDGGNAADVDTEPSRRRMAPAVQK